VHVLITGAAGFIGRNLALRLRERGIGVKELSRSTPESDLAHLLHDSDAVVHLAGVNRTSNPEDFITDNVELTDRLCATLDSLNRSLPLIYSSSIQAENDTEYGRSKREAEHRLERYAAETGASLCVSRLPNVFGKWCRPNYNSVVATFCHNIARDLPIDVHDPSAVIRLIHVDDVISDWISWLEDPAPGITSPSPQPQYEISMGELANAIRSFRAIVETSTLPEVGSGINRALYATYVSYLEPASFSNELKQHSDDRGVFVEFLKTQKSGQFSYFTARPGVTRGGHYHHSKTEKMLVVRGQAEFHFRHIMTNEVFSIRTSQEKAVVVETIPGWTHDIQNIGEDDLVAIVWANEIFDPNRPDTTASKVQM
jgi:UDP-2-acetamido-2,6-beta-L-arabino-hexul-4-ose reductase